MANEFCLTPSSRANILGDTFGYQASLAKVGAMFFVGPGGYALSKIRFRLGLAGSPSDYLVCKVYSYDSTNQEPDQLLATSDQLGDFVNDADHDFIFSGDQKITLTADTYYVAVLERTGAYSSTNYWQCDYCTSASQMPLGTMRYNATTETWSEIAATSSYVPVVFAEDDSIQSILACTSQYYTDGDGLFANALFNFAGGMHFKTPVTGGAKVKIKHVIFGHGQAGVWSGSPGDGDIRVEFHRTDLGDLDWADVSTTRVGDPSDWFTRDLVLTKTDAQYHHEGRRYVTWSEGSEPELDGNTEYYCVFVCKQVGSGSWYIGLNDGDYLGGYGFYKFASDGSVYDYDEAEIWNALSILGYEETPPVGPPTDFILNWPLTSVVPTDKILSWPLTTKTDEDKGLLWRISSEATQDWSLLWKILLSSDWILPWNIESPPDIDMILNWKILEQADHDTALRWQLMLSQDFVLPWHLTTAVPRDTILRYILFSSRADQDTILKWKLLLSQDWILKWGFLVPIGDDWILRWPLTTRLHKDLIARWKLWLTQDWVLKWPLTAPITDEDILKWGISLSTDTVISIPMMQHINAAKALLWNIEDKVWKDYRLRYNLEVSQEWVIKYSLRDVVDRITTLVNDIDNQVFRDWGIRYKLVIESDYVLVIPIRGTVTKDFVLRHGLLAEVDKVEVIKFNLLDYNPVETDTILRNTLLGKPRFYKISFT